MRRSAGLAAACLVLWSCSAGDGPGTCDAASCMGSCVLAGWEAGHCEAGACVCTGGDAGAEPDAEDTAPDTTPDTAPDTTPDTAVDTAPDTAVDTIVDPLADLPEGPFACDNPTDMSIIMGGIASEVVDCSNGCLSETDPYACNTACISTATGLSLACAACYGVLMDCVTANCLSACMVDPTTGDCVTCRATHGCDTDFTACSGILPW